MGSVKGVAVAMAPVPESGLTVFVLEFRATGGLRNTCCEVPPRTRRKRQNMPHPSLNWDTTVQTLETNRPGV